MLVEFAILATSVLIPCTLILIKHRPITGFRWDILRGTVSMTFGPDHDKPRR
jgi:hypothetical protein